ncbi:type 2 phosphatidylinositol 4,5-bisphosphate 4-phosphatase-like isoform X1 [Temnothorax curvispinosus]|uniref:Phosphatidylinositol-4,5-bisphosphate 4-phosphatase n=1 Tax=Temnothorax curvispinosus TaxID=300111 RepID=A0A6J1Q0G5_9HYME|nr:type 2 phosphatidylinositol 4,5-bisphosphate 4-phosphatase-like isoform X1 [Temnothorax curvispinosus]
MAALPIRNAPPVIKYQPIRSDMCWVECAHCHYKFWYSKTCNDVVQCPHCRKISFAGSSARKRGILLIIIGIIAFVVGITATVRYYILAETNGGDDEYYGGGGFLLGLSGLLSLCRGIYYRTMKISLIENP